MIYRFYRAPVVGALGFWVGVTAREYSPPPVHRYYYMYGRALASGFRMLWTMPAGPPACESGLPFRRLPPLPPKQRFTWRP